MLLLCGGSIHEVYEGRERPKGPADSASAAEQLIITGQQAIWDVCDMVARTMVLLSLDPSVNYLVDVTGTASEARIAVREHFAPIDSQGVIRLMEHLFSLRLTSSSLESVDLFIKDYRETHSALSQAECALSDVQSVAHILANLPSAFKTLRSVLGIGTAGSIHLLPTLEGLFTSLRSEALRDRPISASLAASRGAPMSSLPGRYVGGKVANTPPTTPCPVPGCGGLHWSKHCTHPNVTTWRADAPKRAAARKGGISAKLAAIEEPTIQASLASILGADYGTGVEAWLASDIPVTPDGMYAVDSGASHNLSGDKAHFIDFVPCAPEPVGGIAGQLVAIGVGKVAYICRLDSGQTHRMIIHNVLYVPGIRTNLISVSALARKGFVTTFGKDGRITEGATLIARATLTLGGLYKLDAQVVPACAFAHLATTSSIASLTVGNCLGSQHHSQRESDQIAHTCLGSQHHSQRESDEEKPSQEPLK
jgi:hypothetical protein